MVPGNVDEGAGVEEEQEEELPNVLNGMSEGPHYQTYSTQGSEPVPPLPLGVSESYSLSLSMRLWSLTLSSGIVPGPRAFFALLRK